MQLNNFIVFVYIIYSAVDHKIKTVNCSSVQKPNIVQPNSTRESRRLYGGFFPIGGWKPTAAPPPVTIPGPRCTTTTGEVGQCLTNARCSEIGGTPTSIVCDGGTCCIIRLTAPPGVGALTVQHNMTTLTNTNGTTSTTTFRIPRASPNVCQIRVDFQRFSIAKPYSNDTNDLEVPGDCGVDQMTISGADNLVRPLILCGEIGYEEHLYLHYGFSQEISLLLNLTQSNSTYNILVTMINCDTSEAAPEGCAQFYTGPTEVIRSFNFPHQQLNNQYYSICIRASSTRPLGLVSNITWSTCLLYPDDISEFFISGPDPSMSGENCDGQDKITIPGSPNGTYCGGVFPRVVQTSMRPFVLFVEFDEIEFTPAALAVSPGMCPPGSVCLPALDEDGTCSNDTNVANCEFDLTVDNPGILVDSKNTGFCLRYSKLFA